MYVIISYYIEFNGPVMAFMKIKTVQTILLSALYRLALFHAFLPESRGCWIRIASQTHRIHTKSA
jgi:hypothetical protein